MVRLVSLTVLVTCILNSSCWCWNPVYVLFFLVYVAGRLSESANNFESKFYFYKRLGGENISSQRVWSKIFLGQWTPKTSFNTPPLPPPPHRRHPNAKTTDLS